MASELSDAVRECASFIRIVEDYRELGKERYWHMMRQLARLQLALDDVKESEGKENFDVSLSSIMMEER